MATMYQNGRVIQDPAIINTLLNSPRAAWIWLIVRVWLGYKWVDASLLKLNNPDWTQTGEALRQFWASSLQIPAEGISSEWYRTFIQFMLDAEVHTWLAKLVVYGELIIGIALILGAFTGIAAFIGGFVNWNFMVAGSASTNPLLFVSALGLVMAWKVAGYTGLDYFLLPAIGTPWGRKNKKYSS
ncbi:MAG: DoxX family membrane protein [Anaerolineales bacterium]